MWTKLQHKSREKSKNPQLLWRWQHHHRIKQMTLNMLSYLRENCSVFWLFWRECNWKIFLQRFLKGKYCCLGIYFSAILKLSRHSNHMVVLGKRFWIWWAQWAKIVLPTFYWRGPVISLKPDTEIVFSIMLRQSTRKNGVFWLNKTGKHYRRLRITIS